MKDYQKKLIEMAEMQRKLEQPIATPGPPRKIWSEEKLLTQLDKYFNGEVDKGILHIRIKDRLKSLINNSNSP